MAKKATSKTTTSKTSQAAATVKTDQSTSARRSFADRFNRDLSPQALLGEMGGTFVLVSAVLYSGGTSLLIGFSLIVIVAGLIAISGAHLNPAVTFGLWTMRKISGLRVLFYWIAQFIGGIAALVVMHLFSSEALQFSLSSFGSFDSKIFFAELIGMVIFMYGFVAILHRAQNDTSKAAGIGLSFFLGLTVATGLLSAAVQGATANPTPENARLAKIDSVSLNPAVALVLTERDPAAAATDSTGQQMPAPANSLKPSRLTLETLLGTFIGAAIGGNLYTLLAARSRND